MINISYYVKPKEHEKLGTRYTGSICKFSKSLKLLYNKGLLKCVIYDSIYYIKFRKGRQNQTIVFSHVCLSGKTKESKKVIFFNSQIKNYLVKNKQTSVGRWNKVNFIDAGSVLSFDLGSGNKTCAYTKSLICITFAYLLYLC